MTLDEVARRLGEDGFVVLDVRSLREYTGEAVAPCDPRPGRIPGARHLDVSELLGADRGARSARGSARRRARSSSRTATRARAPSSPARSSAPRGYDARNYRGSWHEWSRDESLPANEPGV